MNLLTPLNPSRRRGLTAGVQGFVWRAAGIAGFHHGAPPGVSLR